ncbi:hypothetical protein D9O50_02135 [Oxalobacteraceae bacterium CAVE-383]|nr:hypothetical protein D9O50_02135 [Oxalobacteraceae bacterium CAVE-383]
MTKMSKTLLLPGSLIAAALLCAGCSTTPDAPAADDQLVFQVCLRAKSMAATKLLDFTIVRADRRDIEPAMPVGRSVKDQPVFEAVAGSHASIKSTLLSIDRKAWYGFDLPQGSQAARLGAWSDWRPVDYVSRTEDAAYKVQHDLPIEKQADANREAVKVRFTMMHYKDVLATRASRRLELPRTDLDPC